MSLRRSSKNQKFSSEYWHQSNSNIKWMISLFFNPLFAQRQKQNFPISFNNNYLYDPCVKQFIDHFPFIYFPTNLLKFKKDMLWEVDLTKFDMIGQRNMNPTSFLYVWVEYWYQICVDLYNSFNK